MASQGHYINYKYVLISSCYNAQLLRTILNKFQTPEREP